MNTSARPSLRVSISPHALHNYSSQVLAGLYCLAASGEVSLDLQWRPPPGTADKRRAQTIVFLRLAGPSGSRPVRVAIDLSDSIYITSQHLRDCDVFFKRSFTTEVAHAFSGQIPVLPFGLQFACTSAHERLLFRINHVARRNLMRGRFRQAPVRATLSVFSHPLKLWMTQRRIHNRFNQLPFLNSHFEVPPEIPTQPKVFYRTRIYDRHEAAHAQNEMRVGVIRALRAHFGDRFVGGLRHSHLAQTKYADCLYEHNTNWAGHLATMRDCLIGVTTAGLHGSIDWKVAEYLAAARCVVSERFQSELPQPMVQGVQALFFETPEECIKACENILANPELAQDLRQNAFAYYQANVAPAAVMRRCLDIATSSEIA